MSCSEVFDGSVYPLITWLPSQGALMVTTFNQPVICLDDSTNWIILYWKILIHSVDDKSPAFLNSFSFPGYVKVQTIGKNFKNSELHYICLCWCDISAT